MAVPSSKARGAKGSLAEPDNSSPPPYGTNEQAQSSLLALDGLESAPWPRLQRPFALERPFPAVFQAFADYRVSIHIFNTIKICGDDKHDVYFNAELHIGYAARPPLGHCPRVIVHNGLTHKDPVLCAAGPETRHAEKLQSFNPRSVILLPPLRSRPEATPRDMTTSIMRAAKVSDDKGVSFQVSVLLNPNLESRQEFEWRKIKDDTAKNGGYKLFKLVPPSTRLVQEHEVVALLTWPGTRDWLKSKMFTLEFKGSALSGSLGERCNLMILVTACRIWWLRNQGKTAKWYVGVAEKTHGKEAVGHEW